MHCAEGGSGKGKAGKKGDRKGGCLMEKESAILARRWVWDFAILKWNLMNAMVLG